jgi:hypothetical protein
MAFLTQNTDILINHNITFIYIVAKNVENGLFDSKYGYFNWL